MASWSVSLSIIFLFFFVYMAKAALPGGLKGCKMSANSYSMCLSNEVNKALKILKNGMKGVNPIDPLKFNRLLIDQGTGPVAIKLEFMNLDLIGISNTQITETENDWKAMKLKGHLDRLIVAGDYTISGKVLVLPISGAGKSNITMSNLDVEINIKLKEVMKAGKKYFQGTYFGLIISPKKTYFNLENLFNGDKALGDNMNMFLNENHEAILNELKPAISKGISQGFLQVVNQVFSKIPANEIHLK